MGSEGLTFTTHKSLADRINDIFPYYLSIGMSESQFWDGEPSLVVAYQQAEKLRLRKQNQTLWLQGAYIYEALCDVAPIYHAFAKKGTKPVPYSKEPYCLTKEEQQEREEEKARAKMEAMKKRMMAFAIANNKRIKEQEVNKDE